MKKHRSQDLLENLHQQTEQHIQKAISEWQNMPAQLLNKSLQPGSWSATQCLEHLNIYGRYYLPAIEKAIVNAENNDSNPTDTFKSSWLGNYFTQSMMPNESGTLKKKYKTPSNARPSASPDAEKVVSEFIDQQEKLLKLLDRAAGVNLNDGRIPISIARFIRLKLGDVFMFLIAHNYRHILQAERALRGSSEYQSKRIVTRLYFA